MKVQEPERKAKIKVHGYLNKQLKATGLLY